MAAYSQDSYLGIPWTEKPGGLHPMGSHTTGHDLATNTHKPTELSKKHFSISLIAESFHVCLRLKDICIDQNNIQINLCCQCYVIIRDKCLLYEQMSYLPDKYQIGSSLKFSHFLKMHIIVNYEAQAISDFPFPQFTFQKAYLQTKP